MSVLQLRTVYSQKDLFMKIIWNSEGFILSINTENIKLHYKNQSYGSLDNIFTYKNISSLLDVSKNTPSLLAIIISLIMSVRESYYFDV